MLILHVSDTHLGAIPGGLLFRARDVYEVFRETIDIALREHVDLYIHTGDFFNTSAPPPEAYIAAYRGLKRLRDKGVRIIAIAGQHDVPKKYAMSPLSILKDVEVVDYIAIDNIINIDIGVGNKITFICVPYNLRHKIPALIIPKNSKVVLMAHLLLKELGIPSSEADTSLDTIPSGFKYIALGDYHMKTILRHRDGSPVVYPGSTEIHKVNEYGKKYVALVDISKDEARVEFIELQNVRPWIITACSDLTKCISDITENTKKIISSGKKKPLVYVTLEKVKAELTSRYLDEMVSKGLIEHYIITFNEGGDQEAKGTQSFIEKLEHIDVEKILKELIGNEILANYLRNLVENPSREVAEKLIEYLKSNTENLKDVELKIRSRLSSLTQNNRKNVQQSQDRLFKGKLL